MGNKTILVIMDGEGYEVSASQCEYLEGAFELGIEATVPECIGVAPMADMRPALF